ncbi:Calmodulin-2 [Tritrichomonas foetus]|uniref:Calmodulin-2 n=1 Tax=Tritrichomonas foetus TaxID=1144522 RepID=A0A1J4L1I2_9EUKA|nr:Calmodulin-2 [Tritrichomonas foetus]|eukprot:OHT15749.1 Calmodulin-2 [Tritrichomonas foetus]
MGDDQKETPAQQYITIEELEKLHNAFDAFDNDNDGRVECDLLETLLRAVGFNPTPEEIEDMVIDIQKRPFSFGQFLFIVYRHSRAINVEEELIAAFTVFDKNKSGRLPVLTVRSILESTRQPFTQDQIDDLLEQVDVTNDEVDYPMLVRLILHA